jgi:nucleotide-binding universal stress UspA family protein
VTETHRPRAVVVGVDGSASSHSAIVFAIEEARGRELPMLIVHTLADPPPGLASDRPPALDSALANARCLAPDLEINGAAPAGTAAMALLEVARSAELVVVGARGLGGFRRLQLGSVSSQVATHAECPVVVTRDSCRHRPASGVVVGVDGSDSSDAAVEFAFEEASLRDIGLTAVHAFDMPDAAASHQPRQVAAEGSRVLTDSLVGWQQKYPNVEVTARLVQGHAVAVLAGESVDGQLLVVGKRGQGGFPGLFLGSVSQAMLHHAACPIAVVAHRH